MALQVKSRAPRFRVQIHTKGTVASITRYDTQDVADTALLASIVSISTTRRLGQSGTFQIVLLPRRDAAHRWQDVITPMDYVEIDLSPSGAVGSGATATSAKFRGFVDSVEMVWTLADGRPFPAIRISGRDYSKLLVDMQLYLLGSLPPAMQVLLTWLQGISALDPPTTGSTEIHASSASSASAANLRPDQVITSLFTNWILPFSRAIESALTITTPIQLDASFAQLDATQLGLSAIRPPILVDNFDPLRTAVWTVMGEYSHAPWYELYIEDYQDAPYLVLRPAPWRDINGAWVQPTAWSSITPPSSASSPSPRAPRFIAVDAHEITAIALGRSDAGSDDSPDSASPGGAGGSGGSGGGSSGGGQVNNFFLTYPSPYEAIPTAARNLGSALLTGNNPSIGGSPTLTSSGKFGASDWHEFGWRPMERWSAYSDFPGNDPTTASIGSELNRRLGAAFSFGEYLESGVITIVRDPTSASLDPIHIGDYISLTGALDEFGIDWAPATLFYVESVSHDFRVPTGTGDGSYTIMLGVTRGEGYLDRYPNLRSTSILTPLKNAALTTTP